MKLSSCWTLADSTIRLIARRVRENNVYCEIYSYKTDLSVIKAKNPKGIIFTGGPNSVYLDALSHHRTPQIFELGRARAGHLLRAAS